MEETPKPIKSRIRMFALCIVLLAGAVALALCQMRGSGTSAYQGRPLSKWFEDYVRADQMQLAGGSAVGLEQISEVFCKLGPEAVPYLIHQLTNISSLQEKYVSMKSSSPGWAFKILPTVRVGDWASRRCAALALGEVGPLATNAVPALIEAISKTEIWETDQSKGSYNGRSYSSEARVAAIQALVKIAPDSREVVSALIDALKQKYVVVPVWSKSPTSTATPTSTVADVAAATVTDLGPEFKDQIPAMIANLKYEDQRQYRGGISSIVRIGPYLKAAIPMLLVALTNSNPVVRAAATYDLGMLSTMNLGHKQAVARVMPNLAEALGDAEAVLRLTAAEAILTIDVQQAGLVVPVAVNLLTETNYLFRLRAIDLLRQIGPDAKEAVPSLIKALKDDSRTVQTWATEALKQVDPEAATKAGVK